MRFPYNAPRLLWTANPAEPVCSASSVLPLHVDAIVSKVCGRRHLLLTPPCTHVHASRSPNHSHACSMQSVGALPLHSVLYNATTRKLIIRLADEAASQLHDMPQAAAADLLAVDQSCVLATDRVTGVSVTVKSDEPGVHFFSRCTSHPCTSVNSRTRGHAQSCPLPIVCESASTQIRCLHKSLLCTPSVTDAQIFHHGTASQRIQSTAAATPSWRRTGLMLTQTQHGSHQPVTLICAPVR